MPGSIVSHHLKPETEEEKNHLGNAGLEPSSSASEQSITPLPLEKIVQTSASINRFIKNLAPLVKCILEKFFLPSFGFPVSAIFF